MNVDRNKQRKKKVSKWGDLWCQQLNHIHMPFISVHNTILLEWLWCWWWWWLISLSNKHCTWIFNWIHLSSFWWWINYYCRHTHNRYVFIVNYHICDDDVFMVEFFSHMLLLYFLENVQCCVLIDDLILLLMQ